MMLSCSATGSSRRAIPSPQQNVSRSSLWRGGLWLSLLLLLLASGRVEAQEEFTVAPQNGSFTAVGGSLVIAVNAPAETAWTAVSNAEWLTVSAPASGSGAGSVTLVASVNTNNTFREAQVQIGPRTVFVFQEPLIASVRFLPEEVSVGGEGAIRSITVLVEPQNLPWQAVSNVSWIGILTPQDVGSGAVQFAVQPNRTGQPRTGTISVLGSSLRVTQQAGTSGIVSFTPGSASFPFEGGNGVINVTVNPPGANWFAAPFSPWIRLAQNLYTGDGTINFTVEANASQQARQGSISIGDRTFTVMQAANPNPPEPPNAATFELSSGLVSLSAPVGTTAAVTQSLGINSSGAALNFSIEIVGAPWLSAQSTTGTTPANILFTANPSGLARGTYAGTVRIRSTSNASVVEIPARLRIAPPAGTPPQPSTVPSSLYFSRIVGQPFPAAVDIAIGSAGEVTPINISLPRNELWLLAGARTGASGTTLSVGINNLNYPPGLYRADITVSSPSNAFQPYTIPVAYRVQMAPMGKPYISSGGIVNAASFQQGLAANTWISIFGSNLADTTRSWASGDFQGNRLPTSLDGVEVTIDGTKAAIAFISPTQINVLAPNTANLGEVEVIVSNNGDVSEAGIGFVQETLPALFTFSPMNGKYAAALHLNADPVGPAGLITTGRQSRAAKPSEVIQVFGTGFGPTNPPADPSRLFQGAATLVDIDSLEVTIGGMPASVGFAGLSGTGLNQLNVTVPQLGAGDHEIVVRIGDVFTRSGVFIHVQP